MLTLIQRAVGPEYASLVSRLDRAAEPVYVTIVSFEEQMRGWLSLMAAARTPDKQVRVTPDCAPFWRISKPRPVLDFNEAAATEYQRLVRARTRVGTMDLRIAAIAIAQDGLLISRNLDDFRRIPGLRVEDWASAAP